MAEADDRVRRASVPREPSARNFPPASRRTWFVVGLLVLTAIGLLSVDGDGAFWQATGRAGSAYAIRGTDHRFAQVAFQRGQRPKFDLRSATVPVKRIMSGGPPKDGIPALTDPKQVAAGDANFLRPDDRVIGVVVEGTARAYPLGILGHHEIVNDHVGETPFAVTYCPLCDSAAVFDRRTELGEKEFGVSGLLYNSNVLMYDRRGQPESLWSQLKAEGISGPAAAKPLKALPLELTTWQHWVARYPQTTVLSTDTGHRRNYAQDPYAAYFRSPKLMFPVKPVSRRLPTKQRVLGIWTTNAARAYPVSAFGNKPQTITQELDGRSFSVQFDPASRSLRVSGADDGVQWMYSFWFAWYAFRPQTEVYKQR